jgi:hypothetical protein
VEETDTDKHSCTPVKQFVALAHDVNILMDKQPKLFFQGHML